jgi:hypothetical protein
VLKNKLVAVILNYKFFSTLISIDNHFTIMRVNQNEVKNPTASCGALGEREPPHKITDEAAFIPPAS